MNSKCGLEIETSDAPAVRREHNCLSATGAQKVVASDRGTILSYMSDSEHKKDAECGMSWPANTCILCTVLGRHNLQPRPQSIYGQSSVRLRSSVKRRRGGEYLFRDFGR